MPHLSRKHLPEDTRKLINNALFWTFSSLKGKEIDYIFDSLLTPTERLMLAKRLGILFLVKENKLDSTISEILKVSLPTVARIRLQHKLISSESSNFFFRKLSNWQEFTLFKNVMRNLGFQALKAFSRGMAGKI